MLVLSRRERERIWIGESILLTVVAVKNGQVRLAFEAPEGVAIDREEVRKRRQEFLPQPQETRVDHG
ncbi:MAG: carbon storage regulator [Gemmataceae bacterium]